MDTSYKPISCGLYDQYVLWQMHQQKLTLIPSDESGSKIEHVYIKDIFTLEGVEYVTLEGDMTFRLDQVRLEKEAT